MTGSKKIWFNYWQPPIDTDDPPFYNKENFGWATEIEKNWEKYEMELKKLIKEKNGKFQPYFASSRDTGTMGWKTITLMTWGIKVGHNLDQCPNFKKLANTYPELLSASINLLEPNTSIKEHRGDTNAIFRCHVGLKIPGAIPLCGLKVKNEFQSWEIGKIILFLDAHPHSAWNNTGEERIIFLFDVIRPEFKERKQEICIKVRGFLLLQLLAEKFPGLLKIPRMIQRVLFLTLCGILWILLPLQQRTGVLRHHA